MNASIAPPLFRHAMNEARTLGTNVVEPVHFLVALIKLDSELPMRLELPIRPDLDQLRFAARKHLSNSLFPVHHFSIATIKLLMRWIQNWESYDSLEALDDLLRLKNLQINTLFEAEFGESVQVVLKKIAELQRKGTPNNPCDI